MHIYLKVDISLHKNSIPINYKLVMSLKNTVVPFNREVEMYLIYRV